MEKEKSKQKTAFMKVILSKISNREKDMKGLQMETNIMGSLKIIDFMERANINGKIQLIIMECLKMDLDMALGFGFQI